MILTKPIGTKVAINAHFWMTQQFDKFEKLNEKKEVVELAYALAAESMATLNNTLVSAFRENKIKACTEVAGLGLKGHAELLVQA